MNAAADPLAPGRLALAATVRGVERLREAQGALDRAAGRKPRQLDPAAESRLVRTIVERFEAADLPGALSTIRAWRKAWAKAISTPSRGKDATP